MGRAPCCEKIGLNRGPWTREEDLLLTQHISLHGEGSWRTLPKAAGLRRCGKSCRLRWINYLRPDLKRGNISEEEDQLIIKLHSLLGNRWSLIAGRLPGRTDNEIKNYWNTHLKKKLRNMGIDPQTHRPLASHEQGCPCYHNKNAATCTCLAGQGDDGSYIPESFHHGEPGFSYQKLLGMTPEQAQSLATCEDAETVRNPPSSPISILSQGSSRACELENSLSSDFPTTARELNNFCELPRLSPTSDTATSFVKTGAVSFEVYPVTVDWDSHSHKVDTDEMPPLFSSNDVMSHKQDHVPSGSLLLNIINSDGMWDVEIVRPIEDLDPSMIISEAANTDLWESHYTSCVATGI